MGKLYRAVLVEDWETSCPRNRVRNIQPKVLTLYSASRAPGDLCVALREVLVSLLEQQGRSFTPMVYRADSRAQG